MAKSSGTIANNRGRQFENSVAGILEDAGYELVRPSQDFFVRQSGTQPIYARQCQAGETLYGKVRRCDFILCHPEKRPTPLVIQCKWQALSGSVEEKYPFEVLSIRQNIYPTIILLDGGGYSKGAEAWLKAQVDDYKLLHVFNMGEFQKYASKGWV